MYSSASGGGTSAPATLPIGWTAYTDPATNQTYYVHLPTGDTQWTRPPPPPPPPPQQQQQQQQLLNQVSHPPAHHVHNYNAYNNVTPIPTAPPQNMTQYPPHSHHSNSSHDDISAWNNYNYHNYNNQATTSFNTHHHQQQQQQQQHQPPPTLSLSYDSNWQPKRRRPDYNTNTHNYHQHHPPYPKRTKVEQTNNEGNNNRTKKCSKCGVTRPWESYSKRQWTSGDEARKCKPCVEEDITVQNEQTHTQKEIDANAAGIDTIRTKTCSSCGVTRPWESYSKRQWTTFVDVRKCKVCVEKLIAVPPSVEAIAAEMKDRTKMCSSCKKERLWGSFSKRQWTTPEEFRKCKVCVRLLARCRMDGIDASARANIDPRTQHTLPSPYESIVGLLDGFEGKPSSQRSPTKYAGQKTLTQLLLESANNENNNDCSTAARSEEVETRKEVVGVDKGEDTESAKVVKAEQSIESNDTPDNTARRMESEKEVVARDKKIEGAVVVSTTVKVEETLLDHQDTTTESTNESKANTDATKTTADDDDNCVKSDPSDLANSKTTNNKPPKDDDNDAAEAEPLYPCSKCNKHLSKSLYTMSQWKKKTNERKCNGCVIHPSPKKVKVEQPSLEAKDESNGNEQEVNDCCNKTVLSPVLEVKEENTCCNSTDISPVVEVKEEEVGVKKESE